MFGQPAPPRSVAEHSGAPWFFLDCASVFRRERGEAEKFVQVTIGKSGPERTRDRDRGRGLCVLGRHVPACAPIKYLLCINRILRILLWHYVPACALARVTAVVASRIWQIVFNIRCVVFTRRHEHTPSHPPRLFCSPRFRRSLAVSTARQEFLSKASKWSPSVVVLDQVESLCRKRPEAAGITELQVKKNWRTLSQRSTSQYAMYSCIAGFVRMLFKG